MRGWRVAPHEGMWGLWLTASPLGSRAQRRGGGGKAPWQSAAPSQDSRGAEQSHPLGKSSLTWVFHVLYLLQEYPSIWHRSSMGYRGYLHCHTSLPPSRISGLSPCGIFCLQMFSQRYYQLHSQVQLLAWAVHCGTSSGQALWTTENTFVAPHNQNLSAYSH